MYEMSWYLCQVLVSQCLVCLLISVLLHSSSSHPPISTVHPHLVEAYNLFGKPGDGYYTQVEIGTPPQKFNVLVDTGSSNLAIAGAHHKELFSYFMMKNSSSYMDIGKQVNIVYTQGSWKGHLGRDLVNFPGVPGTVPVYTDISLITTSDNFFVNNSQWQGIVGLAYSALSQPQGTSVPWLDGVVAQQHLDNIFTLELCGPTRGEAYATHTGHLFVGSSRGGCPLPVVTTPIRRAWFYEVLVVGLGVGCKTLNLPCVNYNTDKSIVDSGTSNLLLPPKVFKAVVAELQAQTIDLVPSLSEDFWLGNEEVCWPEHHQAWDIFPNITLHLAYDNNSAFIVNVPPQSYLRPSQDKTTTSTTCWVLGLDKSHTGTVLGTVVLEGLCITFLRGRRVIGFSESTCGPDITLGEVYKSAVDFESCIYMAQVIDGLTLASYVMGGLLGVMGLPLILATIRFAYRSNFNPGQNHDVPFLTLDDTNT